MNHPSSYHDDDGEYVYSADPEHTFFDDCPFNICEGYSNEHEVCKAVLDRRLSLYGIQPKEYSYSPPDEDFINQWKFWMYQHPDSLKGDTKPAKNQMFKRSVEIFLKEGF